MFVFGRTVELLFSFLEHKEVSVVLGVVSSSSSSGCAEPVLTNGSDIIQVLRSTAGCWLTIYF